MRDLLAFQSDFADALRESRRTPVMERWLAGSAATVASRMAIYRANMVAAAEKALAAAYPVVRQVVGEDFFHGLAREYQRGAPSTSGDLTDFGATFGAFVAAFEHTQSLPYLADLARLEWAVHRAYGAADAPDLEPALLAAVEPDQQAAIRFQWAPGTAVLASRHPVVRIWTLHQPGYDGEFSVAWDRPDSALVSRGGLAVHVSACSPAEAAFIGASLAGAALADAAAAALEEHSEFDLAALLGRVLAARLICGFTL